MLIREERRAATRRRSPLVAVMAVWATRSMWATPSSLLMVHRVVGTQWRVVPPAVTSVTRWVLVMVFMVGFLSVGVGLNSIELLAQ
nr:MAG TPA: hypothetical protein [Caudoviricetes sp.]